MKSFFTDVLNINYTSNTFSATNHELLVSDLLVDHGFILVTKAEAKKRVGKKVRLTDETYLNCLVDGEFVPQAYGSQSHPDFLVRYKGQLVKLECKASKSPAPSYNTTAPVADTVYIFTAQGYGTTLFFGRDVLSDEMRLSYKEMESELWAVVRKYQATDLWNDNDRGFSFYMRNMFIQAGGAEKTNYFTHPNRNHCEKAVLEAF